MTDSQAKIQIRDNGELADVRDALSELDIRYSDYHTDSTALFPTHLLISSGREAVQALKKIGAAGQSHHFLHLVITDNASRSLKAMLQRQGCDMVAAGPINQTVLRLLVMRALFSGVERRCTERVTIGVEIKIKSGLLARSATLSELSLRGCGLSTKQANPVGSKVGIALPSVLTGDKSLRLTGEVVGIRVGSKLEANHHTMAVVFANMPIGDRRTIQAIMTSQGFGKTGVIQTLPGTPLENHLKPAPRGDERRSDPRLPFAGSVQGHGAGTSHTLIGRNLSMGGMLVEPEPDLDVGCWLQLAIYGDAGMHPVIVAAEVVRDNGADGLGLSFSSITEPIREKLQILINCLDAHGHTPISAGMVVSEILSREGEIASQSKKR